MTKTLANEAAVDLLRVGLESYKAEAYGHAIPTLGQAFNSDPTKLEIVLPLAVALERTGNWQKALEVYRIALKHNPACGELHNNTGNIYKDRGLLERAIRHYRKSANLNPLLPEPISNLGSIYQLQGDTSRALKAYEQALAIQPAHVPTRLNRALSWLLQGDFEKGLPEYEWRLKEKIAQKRPFSQPRWDGSSFHGKTLFVHAEQGYGDTIQFIRYLPYVKKLGGKVILECQPELEGILRPLQGYYDELIPKTYDMNPPTPFELQVPLLSLPYIFKTTTDSIPNPGRYLLPDKYRNKLWAERLSSSRVNVGICWGGNPKHRHDRYRSCGLKALLPIQKVSFARFFSLQKGPPEEELRAYPNHFVNLGPDIKSFDDTLAIIANLDLVITVDTSVAHVAGAAGVPTWILLPSTPDWRWGNEAGTTAWYPSMRLFRQPRFGDWTSVVHHVRESLKILSP